MLIDRMVLLYKLDAHSHITEAAMATDYVEDTQSLLLRDMESGNEYDICFWLYEFEQGEEYFNNQYRRGLDTFLLKADFALSPTD